MANLVADASALVSLGITAGMDPDPLSLCLDRYEVVVPTAVVTELRATASYDDAHGRAATAVLDRAGEYATRSVDLDADFPLDDGENAAVTLANELDAALLLCDEFTHVGLVHASLADTRLVTTPTLLSILVRSEQLAAADADPPLDSRPERTVSGRRRPHAPRRGQRRAELGRQQLRPAGPRVARSAIANLACRPDEASADGTDVTGQAARNQGL